MTGCFYGYCRSQKRALDQGVNPNTKIHNETILAISIDGKFPEITTLLINAKGIKLNEWNILTQPERSWKYTALMKAVKFSDVVKQLLDKNVLIDLQDDWILWDGKLHESGGNTALMLAVGAPNFTYTESAKLLIDKGAKINIQNKLGYTALMLGVHNTEVSKILIDKGATLDTRTKHGETALMLAAGKYAEVVKMLIDKGANIQLRQSTFSSSPNALDYAAKEGNIEAAKLILKRAEELGIKKEIISAGLHWAVIADQLEMAKYLLDEGALVDGTDEYGKYSPLMETSMPEMVQLLISRGADVNLQDTWGKTALMHSAGGVNALGNKYGTYTEILGYLLEKGAKIDTEDKEGFTALYWAQRYNRTKSAELLLAKGANPAKKYDKATDKSNITSGIVGIWEASIKMEGQIYKTRIVFNKDWSYSKGIMAPGNQWIPDGAGYNRYELRDGRIWLFNSLSMGAVIEWRFEGKDLVLNGEKYIKAAK